MSEKGFAELVVISGKGGTGKTSILASFAALAERAVLADCDVDAADLHLVLRPQVRRREPFSGGRRAAVDESRCIGCGRCAELCRFAAVSVVCEQGQWPAGLGPGGETACRSCSYCVRSCPTRANSEIQGMLADSPSATAPRYRIDPVACEGCGVCAWFCPAGAIDFGPAVNGESCVSDREFGPLVHARRGVGEENSGKLVTTVRREAARIAAEQDHRWLLVDGSPGIGCPVIASITGADAVLIVTEPTLSGLHDLGRVAEVAGHFGIPAAVCVNKWDLNPQVTEQIQADARRRGLATLGRVRYDPNVTAAQLACRSVVEHASDGGSADIRELWRRTREYLGSLAPGAQR